MKLRYLLLLTALFAAAPFARAQVEGAPKLIDYQGTALDANGAPLAPTTPTNYTMKFRIYATQSGGSPIWSEQQTVTVSNGQFSVRLGLGIAIDPEPRPDLSTVFTQKDRYLGLTILIPPQAEGEITPRLAFLTAPFSFVAERAKSADSVSQATGPSTLGTTTIAALTLSGAGQINGNNAMEFGGGIAGKDPNAGKISYSSSNTLDITGAGTNATDRKVNIFAEGGMTVSGTLTATAFAGNGGNLTNLNGANLNPTSVDVTKLVAAVQQALCPPGSIMAYGGTAAPAGWLLCDGTSYPRAGTYAPLFAAIGTAFGATGGSTAFNVPDFRGKFLRGRDGGVSFDLDRNSRLQLYSGGNSGDNVGSFENSAFASHTHDYKDVYISEVQGLVGGFSDYVSVPGALGISDNDRDNSGYQLSRTTAAIGGNETRPVNVTVNYIIKY